MKLDVEPSKPATGESLQRSGSRWLIWVLLASISIFAVFALIYHPVDLTWTAPSSPVHSITYHVYRSASPCAGQFITKQLIGSTRELKFTDASIKFGTFCYTVRTSVNGIESRDSNSSEVVIRPTWRH